MERTLAIVKPEPPSRGPHTGAIISRIEQAGFGRALRLVHHAEPRVLDAVHRDKPFFGQLADFMSSWCRAVMMLECWM